jgi:hypothetical protein
MIMPRGTVATRNTMVKRALKPRPPIAVAAVVVSQLNCLQVLGIDPRRYLEFVAAQRIRRSRVGKLVCVEAEVFVSALRAIAIEDDVEAARVDSEEDEGMSVDEVLASVGRRRVR